MQIKLSRLLLCKTCPRFCCFTQEKENRFFSWEGKKVIHHNWSRENPMFIGSQISFVDNSQVFRTTSAPLQSMVIILLCNHSFQDISKDGDYIWISHTFTKCKKLKYLAQVNFSCIFPKFFAYLNSVNQTEGETLRKE